MSNPYSPPVRRKRQYGRRKHDGGLDFRYLFGLVFASMSIGCVIGIWMGPSCVF